MSQHIIDRYRKNLTTILEALPTAEIIKIIELLEEAREQSRTVFIFGNGGSASTAAHFANDLSKATIVAGKGRFRVISLVDNIALLSAWANDTSYERIFAEQLENFLQPEDVVIAISASGNSPNVLAGVEVAKAHGAHTIGFCGFGGGKLSKTVDIAVVVPSDEYGPVEDVHLMLNHMITTALREKGEAQRKA
ncbi:MAG: SIS domain-containing protein [Candidatus Tectomicrobia bacterium]|nr:SIS domain-containing protein [Candidatus Tectomicrobia bacterium]